MPRQQRWLTDRLESSCQRNRGSRMGSASTGSFANFLGGSGLGRRVVSMRRIAAGIMAQGKDFKGRQFTAEVILWAVRWYLMFPISDRDFELMLQDRGVAVDHTTLFRWIQAYTKPREG